MFASVILQLVNTKYCSFSKVNEIFCFTLINPQITKFSHCKNIQYESTKLFKTFSSECSLKKSAYVFKKQKDLGNFFTH